MTTDDASAALGELETTLLLVGTTSPQGAHFMVANWGTQASFDPWRYVIALKKTSHTLAYARERRALTVNLLPKGAKTVVTGIMKAKGEGHAAEPGPAGAPR